MMVKKKVARRNTVRAIQIQRRGRISKQQNEKHGADLGEGIGFAENAGAKIAQSGDREQHGAGGENRNVAAEDHAP